MFSALCISASLSITSSTAKGRSAGKMIAAKGGAEHAVLRLYMRGDNDTRNREPISHALCNRVYVCVYTCIVVRKELAGSAIATLHTVCNIYRPMFVAVGAYGLQKFFACHVDAAYALYAFCNYSRDFAAVLFEIIL